MNIKLTAEEADLLHDILDFVGGMPTCVDELLDCDMETFNALEEKIEEAVT